MTTVTFALHNLKRLKSDWASLFFNIALPVAMYLIFGAAQTNSDQAAGDGDIAFYVMVGMALYAGISGAVSQSSLVLVEHTTGWGRQLALTPLRPAQLVVARLLTVLVHVALPVAAVNIAGALTGANAPATTWFACYVISLIVALPFGLYGIIWGQVLKSLTAVSIATTSVVLLAFAANVFVPLNEDLVDIGRFTPMYGAVMLARWPLTTGEQFVPHEPYWIQDPLWIPLLSMMVWSAIFAVTYWLLDAREKGRS